MLLEQVSVWAVRRSIVLLENVPAHPELLVQQEDNPVLSQETDVTIASDGWRASNQRSAIPIAADPSPDHDLDRMGVMDGESFWNMDTPLAPDSALMHIDLNC
jgi:hypothetical protein